MPVILFAVVWGGWFLVGMAMSGSEWVANHDFRMYGQRWLWPGGFDPLQLTACGYLLLMSWFIAGSLVAVRVNGDFYGDLPSTIPVRSLMVISLVAAVLCGVQTVRALNDNAKDEGRGYAGTAGDPATIFMVKDLDQIPSFITDLAKDARVASGGPCALVGRHDVTGCLAEGDLPTNWERRVVSITSATYQMRTNSPSAGNTDLRENTVSYLYRKGADGKTEVRVSGVRDGKNNKPLHSVVEWDGRANPTSCAFEGEYALDKAFKGKWSKNLRDLLARKHQDLDYDENDIWGYCDGSEPKVVIPVTRQVNYHQRTVLRPAGVLIVTGDNGKVRITHKSRVDAGELPGPAYPITLVGKQRAMSAWAAGERFHNRGGFGFEPTNASTQLGNASEFLLRSVDDGRTYWVSPLTSRGSDSQQFVAYSVTPADSVAEGELNTQRIYVLNDGDARIATITRMENRIKTFLSADPGFYPAGGKVVEFLPLDGLTWQAYGEVNGMVKYVFTVPLDESSQITAVNLANGQAYTPPQPGTGAGGSPCADFTKATRDQLRDCALRALEEDKRRADAVPSPGAVPSGGATPSGGTTPSGAVPSGAAPSGSAG